MGEMAKVLYLIWINQEHPEPAPLPRGQLEANQAVLRDAHGTAVPLTGAHLGRGFGDFGATGSRAGWGSFC